MARQVPVNLTLDHTEEIKCECGGTIFNQALMLRKISRLVTGESKDAVMPIQVFICVKCQEPLQEFLPDEFKKKKISLT